MMDILWAPWRIGYVSRNRKKKEKCIFCESYKKDKSGKFYVVDKNKFAIAILNLFPYNNGHTMIAPKRHVSDLISLNDEELLYTFKMVNRIISALKKILRPDGFNIGINLGKDAGAGIEKHIHIHVVPRWRGDTNFMPICASTKVIPQSLKELLRRLKKCLQEEK